MSEDGELFLDPTGAPLARLREVRGLGALLLAPLARTRLREALPYELALETPGGAPLARLRRGLALLRPVVDVARPDGAPLGHLRQRLWATGGAFDVIARDGRRLAVLRGSGLFDDAGRALARITAGPRGREVELGASLEGDSRVLMLAAAAAADRVAGRES